MIAERIERTIFRNVQPGRVRYVRPVPRDEAEGLVARVYEQMEADYELVPPITLHSAAPELMAAVWAVIRESLVAGPVSRTGREAVAAAVSTTNRCPFCVDAHAIMLSGAHESAAARAILAGRAERVADPRIGPLVRWALATRSPGAAVLQSPPYPADEAVAFVGTALAFHYINRMVNVFLEDSPFPLPRGFRWLKGLMVRTSGWLFGGRLVSRRVEPGASLEQAFARLAAVIEEGAGSVVPARVRELVQRHVDMWQGEEPAIDRRRVEEAVAGLSDAEQASGRLALLSALASYRVDPQTVGGFRRHFLGDRPLVVTAAWASFTATRRVATWINAPPRLVV
jgi:AhpD family alkylhydroperoxidase